MHCIFCKVKYTHVVKNGRDRLGNQRYKCDRCKRTFTKATAQKIKESKDKRMVLHLILSGCDTAIIGNSIGIEERVIKRWKKNHLKNLIDILPKRPVLSIRALKIIFRKIEKRQNVDVGGLLRIMGDEAWEKL